MATKVFGIFCGVVKFEAVVFAFFFKKIYGKIVLSFTLTFSKEYSVEADL